VIVGAGSCGRAATRAARRAGASIFFMRRRAWTDFLRAFLQRRCMHEHFDQGTIPGNINLFSTLYGRGHARNDRRPQLFLAGDFVPGSMVLAIPLWRSDRVTSGVPPRQTNSSALEAQARRQGFQPKTLHEVWGGGAPMPHEVHAADTFGTELHEEILAISKACAQESRSALRPDRDPVLARHPAALGSAFLDSCDTVILSPARVEKFDTAWIDAALIQEYANEKVRRVILLPGIILLEAQKIRQICRRHGLDLTYARLS
jgi:hypothetical protein